MTFDGFRKSTTVKMTSDQYLASIRPTMATQTRLFLTQTDRQLQAFEFNEVAFISEYDHFRLEERKWNFHPVSEILFSAAYAKPRIVNGNACAAYGPAART